MDEACKGNGKLPGIFFVGDLGMHAFMWPNAFLGFLFVELIVEVNVLMVFVLIFKIIKSIYHSMFRHQIFFFFNIFQRKLE